jgi:hypothetical protein
MSNNQRPTLFLDTLALVRIAANPIHSAQVTSHINEQGKLLIVSVWNLIELYQHQRRWTEVIQFITSVPFCLAQNPEQILDSEVQSYPVKAILPTGFCSYEHEFSAGDLAQAIETNLQDKISRYDTSYRREYMSVLDAMITNRATFPPEANGKYSTFQRQLFLQTNVLRRLLSAHRDFVEAHQSEEIHIAHFRSVYIQMLILFLEYYVQGKLGKPSDVADFQQICYIPYVNLAVLDKERASVVQRINRLKAFPEPLVAFNLAQFISLACPKT